jgi:hypothetical protein
MVDASSSRHRKNKEFMGVIVASKWIPHPQFCQRQDNSAAEQHHCQIALFIRGATIDLAERALWI